MSARAINLPENPSITPMEPSGARKIQLQDKDISSFRSLISAPLKGLLKELPSISKMADPISWLMPKSSLEEFYEKQVEEILPTKEEFAEKSLERFGKALPYGALGGIPGIVGAGASALAGQTAEELGASSLAQTAIEMAALSAPSLSRKIIPSNAQQKSILELGRKFGMSEEQLAPLMPDAKKIRAFGKFASTGEGTVKKLKETKTGVSNIYDTLSASPEAKKFLDQKNLHQFSHEMNALGKKMPHAVRSQLKNDAADLVSSSLQKGGVSGEDLMNFYKDVSSRYNVGRSELELFKGPIKKAISSLDPELGKNFETVNQMWAKQSKIASKLKPGQFEKLINLGEAAAIATSLATGNPSIAIKVLGLSAYRNLSRELLINPRLQNLLKQSQHAIEKNKIPLLKKTGEEFLKFKSEED